MFLRDRIVFSSKCDISNGKDELAGGAQYMSSSTKMLVLYIFCPKRQRNKGSTKQSVEGHCVDLQMLGRRMREDGRTKTQSAAAKGSYAIYTMYKAQLLANLALTRSSGCCLPLLHKRKNSFVAKGFCLPALSSHTPGISMLIYRGSILSSPKGWLGFI
jgi:hypothetical protein